MPTPSSSNNYRPVLDKNKSGEDGTVEQDVIETNTLFIKKTGSSYIVKSKTTADAYTGASSAKVIPGANDLPTQSPSAGNNWTLGANGASNAIPVIIGTSVHPNTDLTGFTGDHLASGIKTNSGSVKTKDNPSIAGNNFSPKGKKSSTPYKVDLTRKALAQRESTSTPKATKTNNQSLPAKAEPAVTTGNYDSVRTVIDTMRTNVERLLVRHNSNVAGRSNTGDVKKHTTPYKVDLTRKALSQREPSANSSHTKVTMYDTGASNNPGKSFFSTPDKLSSSTFRSGSEITPSKQKIRSHTSAPGSGTKVTLYDTNLNSSQGTFSEFSQSRANHHADLPHKPAHKPALTATVTNNGVPSHHTRVTMFETPTKATPNVDILRRLDTDPLPATQTENNTNILCFNIVLKKSTGLL